MRLPLEWLAPAGLSVGALLAPLVLLYILKVRRQRRRVPSVWLWQAVRRDLMARSPFQKLVLQLPLVLQALGLVAFALAAARPATRGKQLTGEHVAIVVDTSASMSALDPKTAETRLNLAKAAARELLLGLSPGSDAMVLDAGREPRVALPPDRDQRRLRAAIEGLAAHDVEGDLGAAVALAAARLKQLGGDRSIVVLTDGNLARPLTLSGSPVPIELLRVGERIDNAAIVRLDVRSGLDPALDREQVQAFLLLANYGEKPLETFVTMRERNASDVLDSRRVRLEPGTTEPVVLTFHPAPGDYGQGLLFELSPHDAMAIDDVAYGRVPVGLKLPVLYAAAAGPSPWLLRALVADELAEVRTLTVAELLASAQVDRGALVVIEGACPPDAPGGDLVLLNPPAGQCYGALVGESIEAPLITSWDHSSPRLRFVSLDGVTVAAARAIRAESRRAELIRSAEGVIAADVSTAARTATLVGFDVGDSNWPLKASFVLFARNLLEQARLHRSSGIGGPAVAGDPLRVTVPSLARDIEVEGPDGATRHVPAHEGLCVVPESSRVGLYRVGWSSPAAGSVLVPVNLSSPAESDLRRQPEEAKGPAGLAPAVATAVISHHDWSWLLALLGLGFVTVDVWYLTRRPRALAPAAAQKPRLPERRVHA